MNLQLPGDFRHAMAKEQSRYAINGVEVRKAGSERVLVTATDGRVLVNRLQNGVGPDKPVIIPSEMVPTLKGGGTITQTGDNELRLVQGKKTQVGEVGVGAFPPFADILPEVTGVADLDVVRNGVEEAQELVGKLKIDQSNGSPSSDTLNELVVALDLARVELLKSHVREVGISGVLLHNLARSVNAGSGEGNLGVTLILPMNSKQPICVLPQGAHPDADSLGVLMPIRVDAADSGTWERRRKLVLEALKTDQGDAAADQGDAAADQGDAMAEEAQGQTDPDGDEEPARAGYPDMDSAGGDGQYERGYPDAGR